MQERRQLRASLPAAPQRRATARWSIGETSSSSSPRYSSGQPLLRLPLLRWWRLPFFRFFFLPLLFFFLLLCWFDCWRLPVLPRLTPELMTGGGGGALSAPWHSSAA